MENKDNFIVINTEFLLNLKDKFKGNSPAVKTGINVIDEILKNGISMEEYFNYQKIL